MTTLTELRDMLDAATGPSREIDREIYRWLVWTGDIEDWPFSDGVCAVPSYASSIDAAMALVERAWDKHLPSILRYHGGSDNLNWEFVLEVLIRGKGCESEYAPTAPLAILKALVGAKIAESAE